jgi:hypothetical protein
MMVPTVTLLTGMFLFSQKPFLSSIHQLI